MTDTNQALRIQLLEWLAAKPRTYAEAMEAWRTSCPRLSIWEDCETEGLIEVRYGRVEVTAKGFELIRSETNR